MKYKPGEQQPILPKSQALPLRAPQRPVLAHETGFTSIMRRTSLPGSATMQPQTLPPGRPRLAHEAPAAATPARPAPTAVLRKAAPLQATATGARPQRPFLPHEASVFHTRAVQRAVPATGRPFSSSAVVQRMEWSVQDDLMASNERNQTGKAQPVREREIFDAQSTSSYGYDNRWTQVGGQDVGYKKGFGSQPFMFGGVDYDSIVSTIESSGISEKDIATNIFGIIDHGISIDYLFKGNLAVAVKELVALTQVIESHDSRIPGADKLARALFRAISDGQATFRQCFNRKNGLFLPAWKKKAGAICGGQEAMRAFLELTRKKSDNLKITAETIKGVITALPSVLKGHLSDDSESD